MTAPIIIVLCLVFAASLIFAFRVGRYVGEQVTINRMIDATDPEMWNAAHYARADAKNDGADAVVKKLRA